MVLPAYALYILYENILVLVFVTSYNKHASSFSTVYFDASGNAAAVLKISSNLDKLSQYLYSSQYVCTVKYSKLYQYSKVPQHLNNK
jgi:hypothetical protein